MLSTLTPPDIPAEVLARFALDAHGLKGQWTRLEGERDQNSRVTGDDGMSWVFKVCNPDEGEAILGCQADVLDHIAAVDPSLPVPRLRRANDGAAMPALSHAGRRYPVMLLSYLPGRSIGETRLSRAQLLAMGRLLARLGLAMRGFVSGAPAQRKLVWNTAHAVDLAGQVANLPEDDQALAEDILARHRNVTVPILKTLRSQIIHGDVHPYNSLIDEDGEITGIIDFGDIVHAALAQDISNAAADFLVPGGDHVTTLFELVRGYASVTRLEEAEADTILDMVEVRLLLTALVESLKATHGITSAGYFELFNARAVPMIRELRALGRDKLHNDIRRAANFPPKSARAKAPGADIIARRRRVMGDRLYVFYDPPLHMVKGEGVWLTASDGRRYLDCYNNVPHVGHCHPYVTEAIVRQARRLNTNTRYLTDESVAYAERLVALSEEGLSVVVFVNSGSEANDLAWRMAKAWTGRSGGLAMDFAYHGVTEAMDAFSPSNAPATWCAPHIRLLPAPDVYRGPYSVDEPDLGERYAALADPLIAELDAAGFGVAAAMIDSAFMTNGILDAPAGYLLGVVRRLRAAGGLFIADEVQSGFGRMGTEFWGHRHHGVTPDFITIGKPAGNGHPVGAVITRPEILDRFTRDGPFFSTFGGNNVACAAGIAVLDVIRDEQLVDSAGTAGNALRAGLRQLMARYDVIGDVRGVGLAIGMELVRDRATKEPATAETTRLLSLIRDEGVLMGGEGRFGNVVKIRPPIIFSGADVELALAAADRALSRL